jgi:hypothetical protein
MTDSPRFSIVIPTRNRADLLREALRSVLDQDFEDYEIVVSNNDSSDHTEAVIAEAGPRLRHLRTESTLSMPDHWDWVLQFARGEYVTYLCDDDALAPNALSVVDRVLRESSTDFVVSPYVPYITPQWYVEKERNTVLLRRYGYGWREIDSMETLRQMFTCRDEVWAPRMLNSFGRRSLIMDARERAGGLFWMCPDYSFATCVLPRIPSFVMVDAPIRLFGFTPQSVGASMTHDSGRAAFETFNREMGGKNLFQHTPVKVALTPNMICETLLISKERLPGDLATVEVDRPAYYQESFRYIAMLEAKGADMRAERAAFEGGLAKEPPSIRDRVQIADRGQTGRRWRRAIRRLFPMDGRMQRAAFRLGLVRAAVVSGDRAGFSNIAQCADWMMRQSRPSGVA